MNPQDTHPLTDDQLKLLLKQVFLVTQKPVSDLTDQDFESLLLLVSNTQFFQRNLDSQASFDEFMKHLKYHLVYEAHPAGTVLLNEGQYANKLSIILRGTVARYNQKTFAQIQRETREREEQALLNEYTAKKTAYELSLKNLDKDKQHRSKRHSKDSHIKPHINITKPSGKDIILIDNPDDMRKSFKRPGILMGPDPIAWGLEKTRAQDTSSEESSDEEDIIQEKRDSLHPPPLSRLGKGSFSKVIFDVKSARRGTIQEQLDLEFAKAILNHEDEPGNDLRHTIELEQKDRKLFQEMVQKNPNLVSKYFVGDIFKYTRMKEYLPGTHFGENFLKDRKPKEDLLVATQEVHLLSLSKDGYLKILGELHDRMKHRIDFFCGVLASLNDENIANFAYYFKEKTYQKGESIYSEGDPVESLFLLESGDVQLSKKTEDGVSNKTRHKPNNSEALLVNLNRTSKPKIPIASVIEGQFFGEELLLKQSYRQYTAEAKAPGTKVYYLEPWLYYKIKGNYVKLLDLLKSQAQDKSDWRQARIEDIKDNKAMLLDQIKLVSVKHKSSDSRNKWIPGLGLDSKTPRFSINLAGINSVAGPQGTIPLVKGAMSERLQRSNRHDSLGEGVLKDETTITMDNLFKYKEKYSRQTILAKVGGNEPVLKRIEDERRNTTVDVHNKDMEVIIPIKTHKNRHLPSLNSPYHLPSFPSNQSIASPRHAYTERKETFQFTTEGSYESFEEQMTPIHGHMGQMQSMENYRHNIVEFLAPKYQEGDTDDVIKSTNGSMFVVSGRSKLRGILKTMDQMSGLSGALQSPVNPKEKVFDFAQLAQSARKASEFLKVKPTGKIRLVKDEKKGLKVRPLKIQLESLKVKDFVQKGQISGRSIKVSNK